MSVPLIHGSSVKVLGGSKSVHEGEHSVPVTLRNLRRIIIRNKMNKTSSYLYKIMSNCTKAGYYLGSFQSSTCTVLYWAGQGVVVWGDSCGNLSVFCLLIFVVVYLLRGSLTLTSSVAKTSDIYKPTGYISKLSLSHRNSRWVLDPCCGPAAVRDKICTK